ncbi:MAG: DUF371 domain-containing protein [Candidatus Thorarchaeota archaeon]|jgi:hypothetical protein
MQRVRFQASGHENVIGEHRTTVEITTEDYLTREGTCIIGIRADKTLNELPPELKELATSEKTKIILRLKVGDLTEEVTGRGNPGLTYSDSISMVARKSSFVCDRTLMVGADKAASDLGRPFVAALKDPGVSIECELLFFTE